jgi:flagellar biosynthesis/type III secretory pathway M-ring protein FliF/YscJ
MAGNLAKTHMVVVAAVPVVAVVAVVVIVMVMTFIGSKHFTELFKVPQPDSYMAVILNLSHLGFHHTFLSKDHSPTIVKKSVFLSTKCKGKVKFLCSFKHNAMKM